MNFCVSMYIVEAGIEPSNLRKGHLGSIIIRRQQCMPRYKEYDLLFPVVTT